MKLTAFRIRNFRSIVDSQWNYLSPDNVTTLIGQNESGKTSVLEALRSFYDGNITDEVLRSDLSMPEISCEFEVSDLLLKEILLKYTIPSEINDSFKQSHKVILTRSWINPKINKIEVGGEIITAFYGKLKSESEALEKELTELFLEIDSEGLRLEKSIAKLLNEKDIASFDKQKSEKLLVDFNKQFMRARTPGQKEILQNEINKLHLNIEHARQMEDYKFESIQKHKEEFDNISDKVRHVRNARAASARAEESLKYAGMLENQILSLEEAISDFSNPREIKISRKKLDIMRQQLFQTKDQFEKLNNDAILANAIAGRIIKGLDFEDAKKLAIQQLAIPNETASREDLGRAFFEYCPEFELFEDFGSLLPNRIDLDDLINENTTVEGYKAAVNFLIIAGVDASYFQQTNNRILKQKIENLNGEITINFQDFWRQNIGKNSKIRINFELEHYDYNHPEKRGKPYLEFWIKDTKERLYPKQRSRGVRWFLSFYLELKATAKKQQKNRVLLIDEPGISLHARAQDDVLKVFEDLKESLSIVYTTHSPHLVDVNKLYRILAVQRAVEDDDTSESLIFDIRTLCKASADTLSPVYSLMGARFSEQQFIQKSNNIIVENNCAYYLLTAYLKLFYPQQNFYILPATDISNIPTLANLLVGWKLGFIIVLSGTPAGNHVYSSLKISLYGDNQSVCDTNILKLHTDNTLFDLISTIDFKNHILHQRVGITERNSEYIENNNLSCVILAMEFMNNVLDGRIKTNDLDEDSVLDIHAVLENIIKRLI